MTKAERSREIMSSIYSQRGYLVIAGLRSHPTLQPGEIVSTVTTPLCDGFVQPMRVIQETDRADFIEQQALWERGEEVDSDYDKFYRVEGD